MISFDIFPADRRTRHRLRAEFRERGVAVLTEPAIETALWLELREEAHIQRGRDSWRLQSLYNAGEISQDNMRGYLGPRSRAFLSDSQTCGLLYEVTGRQLRPGWSASCYTYYDAPGFYMGEHCDKVNACRIAMLVYLDARWPAGRNPGPGLGLHVFEGDSSASPLVARITAHDNRVVILNGAAQAHFRPPLGMGESLVMLAGCYEMAAEK
jgi:hypothetical protein